MKKSVDEKQRHHCQKCDRFFKDASSLNHHIRFSLIHDPNNRLHWPICGHCRKPVEPSQRSVHLRDRHPGLRDAFYDPLQPVSEHNQPVEPISPIVVSPSTKHKSRSRSAAVTTRQRARKGARSSGGDTVSDSPLIAESPQNAPRDDDDDDDDDGGGGGGDGSSDDDDIGDALTYLNFVQQYERRLANTHAELRRRDEQEIAALMADLEAEIRPLPAIIKLRIGDEQVCMVQVDNVAECTSSRGRFIQELLDRSGTGISMGQPQRWELLVLDRDGSSWITVPTDDNLRLVIEYLCWLGEECALPNISNRGRNKKFAHVWQVKVRPVDSRDKATRGEAHETLVEERGQSSSLPFTSPYFETIPL